jgi:hypothetical protein
MSNPQDATPDLKPIIDDLAMRSFASIMLDLPADVRAAALARMEAEAPQLHEQVQRHIGLMTRCQEAITAEEVSPFVIKKSFLLEFLAHATPEDAPQRQATARLTARVVDSKGKLGTPELLFLDPFFRLGLNVTVRDGRKWDAIAERLPQPVVVKKAGEEAGQPGKIVGKYVCKAKDIPDFVTAIMHAPERLYDRMKAAYGESWTPENEVTVLFFTLDD